MKNLYPRKLMLLIAFLSLLQKSFAQTPTATFTVDNTVANYDIQNVLALPNGQTAVMLNTPNYANLLIRIYDKNGTLTRTIDYTSQITFPNVNPINTEFNFFTTSGGNIFITYNCSDSYQMLTRNVKYLVYDASGTLLKSGTVNTADPGTTQSRFVTMTELSNGNVVISWQRSDNNSYAFRIFSPTGTALLANDVAYVGTGSLNPVGNSLYTTVITASKSGGFMAIFYYYTGCLKAIRFDNNGNIQQTGGSNLFIADATVSNEYWIKALIGLSNGNYLMVYALNSVNYYKIVSPAGVDVKAKTLLGIDWPGDVKPVNTPAGEEGFLIAETVYQDPSDVLNPYNYLKVHRYNLSGVETSSYNAYTPKIDTRSILYTGNPQGYGIAYKYYKAYDSYIEPDYPEYSYSYGTGDADITAITYDFPGSILPVHFSSFTAEVISGKVELKWTVSFENGNDRFVVERSEDGVHFTAVATVKGAANGLEHTYSWMDRSPLPGTSYYRLLQYDLDGKSSTAGIRKISFSSDVLIYPNPVKQHSFTLKTDGRKQGFEIFSATGAVVAKGMIEQPFEKININKLTPGIYRLRLEDGQTLSFTVE